MTLFQPLNMSSEKQLITYLGELPANLISNRDTTPSSAPDINCRPSDRRRSARAFRAVPPAAARKCMTCHDKQPVMNTESRQNECTNKTPMYWLCNPSIERCHRSIIEGAEH